MPPHSNVQLLRGNELEPYMAALARLRITVFREWPYLYEGNEDYETRYLQSYANSAHSLTILWWHRQQLIGASTALPIKDAEPEMQKPLEAAGYPLQRILYFGESLILAPFRGRGIGTTFFSQRENHARRLGLDICCFCAVERSENDPRKPTGYRGNATLWQRQGYRPTDLFCHFNWPDLGVSEASPKPMRFWKKQLERQ